jgi:hypothetical protein
MDGFCFLNEEAALIHHLHPHHQNHLSLSFQILGLVSAAYRRSETSPCGLAFMALLFS